MTTVEWLRKELETIPNYSAFYTNNYQWIDSIMNEAKGMEKQQIKDAWINSLTKGDYNSADEYYNETYKNTEQ